MFRPEKYKEKIEDSRRRLAIARCFQEPDRVPITISAAGSYYCWLSGYDIRDYYQSPYQGFDLQIEVQLRGLEWRYEHLDDDSTGYGIHLDLGPVAEGIYFNLPIEYPKGTSPWIVPQLKTPQDIEKLEIPDPEEHQGVLRVYQLGEELKQKGEKMGLELPVGFGFGIHPPLSCACAIMDPDLVYYYMRTEPQIIHKFFRKLLLAFFKLQDFQDKYFGTKTQSIGLCDDNSAFISAEMYRKMVLPYNLAIYQRYGKRGRYLHADGPNDHLFEILAEEVKLTSMDMGGWSDIVAAKKAFSGKVVFSGGLNSKDLYGSFEEAKPAVERAIRIGAPGGGYILAIGGETYVRVNPDTLIKVVQYAKEIGKYPTRLPRRAGKK